MLKRNNTSSIITIALMFPLVLLFQNCGSSSSSNGTGEMSKREAYNAANSNNLGYSSVAGGSGSGGSSGGTFTLPGGGSGGASSGGSSSGGSSGGSSPTIKTDGTNCVAGEYGIASAAYNVWGGDDFTVGQMRKYLPLQNKQILSGSIATIIRFPDELHGETTTLSCEVSFEKLRKFFPARFYSQYYDCSKNAGNITTMQCRSGQWFVAGSSCTCVYVPPVNNGSDR